MRPATLAFIALTSAVLVGTFYWFKSHQRFFDDSHQQLVDQKLSEHTSLADTLVSPERSNTPLSSVQIGIARGERVAGPAVIQLNQGDEVQLQFTSAQDGELHIHGYDITVELQAGAQTSVFFHATHSGRFEYELHGHHQGEHATLGAIEVMPR